MTYSQAQREFSIRHYLWGQSEFKTEIAESFPVLRSFKSGRFWHDYHFMQRLDRREQEILASGLLKKNNLEAVQALGENILPEEQSLLDRRGVFREVVRVHFFLRQLEKDNQLESARDLFQISCPNVVKLIGEIPSETQESLRSRLDAFLHPAPSVLEEEIYARRLAGEKLKFASKAKIRRAILKQFKAAFGNKCFDLAIVGMDTELDFKMKWNGWIINTGFDFEVRGRQFDYVYSIVSEITNPPHGIPAVILSRLGMMGFLGLKGSVGWGYLIDEDIQPTCDFIIQRSRNFFEVLPKLLKGLEFDKITES